MISKYEIFSTVVSSLYRDIQKIERTEMAKYGLKGPHAQCLLVMERNPEGITASQLCLNCEKDKAAISRTLSELVDAGMITRVDPNGKRYRSRLYLTEKGRAVAKQVNDRVHQAVSQVSEGYDVETREIFVHVLGMIAVNLQELCKNGLQKDCPA